MATLTLFNHDGSHYDPPSHVLRGGRTVDQEPLEKFIGQARILDFRPEYLASSPIKAFATDNWTIGNAALYPKLRAMRDAGTPGRVEDFLPEHHALLGRDIPNIEGLTNLEPLLGARNVVFVGFPLKIPAGQRRAAARRRAGLRLNRAATAMSSTAVL